MEDKRSSRQIRVYEIERLLASGGVGAVYLAHHQITHMPVALKVIRAHSRNPEAQRARFLREVRAAARIGHPGIVRVYDAGETEEGDLFLAMELLQGRSLEEAFAQESSAQVRMGWMAKILEPLKAAHNEGIVHRDLKPANVFLTETPSGVQVKLLDFGIAADARDGRVTQTGMMLGTPYYMSPEQALTPSQVGPAGDIWSFGVMLYEALTGEVPFVGETPHTVVVSASSDPHPPLLEAIPDLMPELSGLVDACLEKDPQQRLSDASVVLARLQPILRDSGFSENMAHLSTVRELSVPRDLTRRDEAGDEPKAVAGYGIPSVWSDGPTPAPSLDDLDTVAPLDVSLRRARRRQGRSGLMWAFGVFASVLMLSVGQTLMERGAEPRLAVSETDIDGLQVAPQAGTADQAGSAGSDADAKGIARAEPTERRAQHRTHRQATQRPESSKRGGEATAVRPPTGAVHGTDERPRVPPAHPSDGSSTVAPHTQSRDARPGPQSKGPPHDDSNDESVAGETPSAVDPAPQDAQQEVQQDVQAEVDPGGTQGGVGDGDSHPEPPGVETTSRGAGGATRGASDVGSLPDAGLSLPELHSPPTPPSAVPAPSQPVQQREVPDDPWPAAVALPPAAAPARSIPAPSPPSPPASGATVEPQEAQPMTTAQQGIPLPEGPAPIPLRPTLSRWAEESAPPRP